MSVRITTSELSLGVVLLAAGGADSSACRNYMSVRYEMKGRKREERLRRGGGGVNKGIKLGRAMMRAKEQRQRRV